jgi:tetratricopeptide (TPR) repeat protein
MSTLEEELRLALHEAAPDAAPDVTRWQKGVERRRRLRAVRRAALTLSLAAVVGAWMLYPRAPNRPTPMFAIEIFRSAAAAEPSPDEQLLRQAFARYKAGRDDEARALLERLLNEYPLSPHVGEAAVGCGDFAFERSDFLTALSFYKRVQWPPRIFRYALYKTGWAHENLGERDAAADAFTRAIDGGDPTDPVVREARKDLHKLRP